MVSNMDHIINKETNPKNPGVIIIACLMKNEYRQSEI